MIFVGVYDLKSLQDALELLFQALNVVSECFFSLNVSVSEV